MSFAYDRSVAPFPPRETKGFEDVVTREEQKLLPEPCFARDQPHLSLPRSNITFPMRSFLSSCGWRSKMCSRYEAIIRERYIFVPFNAFIRKLPWNSVSTIIHRLDPGNTRARWFRVDLNSIPHQHFSSCSSRPFAFTIGETCLASDPRYR